MPLPSRLLPLTVAATIVLHGIAPARALAPSSAAAATKPTPATVRARPTSTTTARAPSPHGRRSATVYAGKGGFTLDLSKCPMDWDINQGITRSKEIHLFTSQPKSGALGGFGLVSEGIKSYFEYLNSQGGVAGYKLFLDAKDDGYDPQRTRLNVSEAIASADYAAMVGVLGTANNLAIWDDANRECMPQLLNASGAVQWGDVDDHPWTTGIQMDYTTEAGLWADWVKKSFPSTGARVATLTFNNDFGHSYSKAFKAAVKGTKIVVVDEELHDAGAPTVTNQMTNIESALPDVILLETTGAFCTQAMAEIQKRHITAKVMLSNTCASLPQFFQPLIDQGLTGNGTYMVQVYKDVNDKEFANDPAVKLYHRVVKSQGLDATQSLLANGWVFAIAFADIVAEAARYTGGVNRANLMLAARGVDHNNPLVLDGITTRMQGTEDAYYIEGGRVVRYKASDPKSLGSYFPQAPVVNREGQTGTYRRFHALNP